MADINKTRVPMSEIPVKDRIKNFKEVPKGYTEEQAIEEAKRCIQCSNSPCFCSINKVNVFICFLARCKDTFPRPFTFK